MNACVKVWLQEWDWRPLARTIVWLCLAIAAARRNGFHTPSLGSIVHELALGFLLTGGLLTWLQLWLASAALQLFWTLDDWTFAASEWVVRPVAGRRTFTARFVAALAVQLCMVIGAMRHFGF